MSKASLQSCDICAENMNKTSRSRISCGCGFECCKDCAKKYILGGEEEAKCMNCKRVWSRGFLLSQMGTTFVNRDYKVFNENLLFLREQAMLQASMPYIEETKKVLKHYDDLEVKCIEEEKKNFALLKELEKSIEELIKKIDYEQLKVNLGLKFDAKIVNKIVKRVPKEVSNMPEYKTLYDKINKYQEAHKEYTKVMKLLKNIRNNQENVLKVIIDPNRVNEDDSKEKVTQPVYQRKCPAPDCVGFLNAEWKCGICSCVACKHCREIINEEKGQHTCDKNILETIKSLEKDTKPCPKCSANIFKINGCDQMYCVSCHTPFSWTTGKIETGVIHNPHYFEYKRRAGQNERNPLEVRCGREIDYDFIDDLDCKLSDLSLPEGWKTKIVEAESHYDEDTMINIVHYYDPSGKYQEKHPIFNFVKMCGRVIHLRQVILPRYVVNEHNIMTNMIPRINYALKELDEDSFKRHIYRKNKMDEKNKEICALLNTYIQCFTEIIYRLYDKPTVEHSIEIENEIFELIEYINLNLSYVGKIYKCKIPRIEEF